MSAELCHLAGKKTVTIIQDTNRCLIYEMSQVAASPGVSGLPTVTAAILLTWKVLFLCWTPICHLPSSSCHSLFKTQLISYILHLKHFPPPPERAGPLSFRLVSTALKMCVLGSAHFPSPDDLLFTFVPYYTVSSWQAASTHLHMALCTGESPTHGARRQGFSE